MSYKRNHITTYTLDQTECAAQDAIFAVILVQNDTVAPEIDCVDDVAFTVPFGEPYELFDFRGNVTAVDNCQGEIELTQVPVPGIMLNTSENEIFVFAKDGVGNESQCSFKLTLVFTTEEEIQQGVMSVLPNPATNQVIVFNPQKRKISTIEIWNLAGQRVTNFQLNNSEIENQFSLAELSSGLYFIKLIMPDRTQMIRLVIE